MTEKKKLFVLCVALFCFMAVSAQQRMSVSSPDGKLRFSLKVTSESVSYDIDYRKQPLITNSLLGFSFDSGEFGRNLKAGKVQRKKIDETYKLIVGKTSSVRSRCNEMTVPMQEPSDSGRLINLVVRAFDDGIAFRYEFPEQKAWDSYVMYDERTQFNLQGNPMALLMYLPGYVNTHEGVYSHVRYDKVARKRLIEMPATFEFDNGVAVAITEGWTGGKALAKTGAGEDKGRDRQLPTPYPVARNLRCRPGGRIAGDEYTNKPERALQD